MKQNWDDQLRLSEILPDFSAIFEDFAERSAAVFDRHPFQAHQYGPAPRQWLEWLPGEAQPNRGNRMIMFIHGGYWRARRAEDHRFVLPALLPGAKYVANAEYRLLPGARMRDAVADIVAAAQALLRRFPDCELALAGHSAGAHLAACAARDERIAAHLSSLILLSGLYDLAPVTHSFLQAELHLTQAEVNAYSIGARPAAAPALLLVGERETPIFHAQAEQYAGNAGSAQLRRVAGADHLTILRQLAERKPTIMTHLDAWDARSSRTR
ncbi:MAG: alpha/beta hydrolase fold domain-containing protein [Gammaproteobacteria bacterium]|nr:alpha/beta hydrolase fold domain-containing protein [Gammaproteobacteria bacterium]